MMRYKKLQLNKKHFQSFTGLTVNEFKTLVANLQDDWAEQRIERLNENNPNRQRKIGGGRKKSLEALEDQLLLTLVWARLYPTYLLLEYFFNIDESTVCRTLHATTLLLQDKFTLPQLNRRKGKKISTL